MTDFVCRRCGDCCSAFELSTVKDKEAKRLDPTKLCKPSVGSDRQIIKLARGWLPEWFRDGVCSFYDQNKGCIVYNDRPDLCKRFECGGKFFLGLVTAVSGGIYHDRRLKSERKKELFLKFLKSRYESRERKKCYCGKPIPETYISYEGKCYCSIDCHYNKNFPEKGKKEGR